MEIMTISGFCKDCGCLFSKLGDETQHSFQCPATDSKFIFGGLVQAKIVKNPFFTPMIIVSVLKDKNGRHIYNAQGKKCNSLVITGGENDFDFWEEPMSERSKSI